MIIAYGAYGEDTCENEGAGFKKEFIPLLKRGWIIVVGMSLCIARVIM